MDSVHLSSRPPALPSLDLGGPSQIKSLPNALQALSLTILGPTGRIEGPGGPLTLQLEPPRGGPGDVPLNEMLQQIDGLANLPVGPAALGGSVDQLIGATGALARAMNGNPPLEPKEAAAMAQQAENQATLVERSILDVIENSTYPNFSDFLKDLVKIAQQLREKATEAKLASIEANYELMKSAADQMLTAANEAKTSREKEIQAAKNEAIGKIVGGILSIGIAVGFGAMGAAQLGGVVGQASSSIIDGSIGSHNNQIKLDGSTAQFKSDIANVAKQRLEAAAKLIEQQTQIADDLREAAKGLRDMILKLYQDFINAQNQAIQRANV